MNSDTLYVDLASPTFSVIVMFFNFLLKYALFYTFFLTCMLKESFMHNVYLDNELVNFEGPELSNLEQLMVLIGRHLEEKGRCIDEFLIDGKDFLNISGNDSVLPEKYEKVEVRSVELKDHFKKRLLETLSQSSDAVLFMEKISGEILFQSWDHGINLAQEVVVKLHPVVRLVEDLAVYPETCMWKEFLMDMISVTHRSFNLYTSAIALKDPASVVEILKHQIDPLVRDILEHLEGPVTAYFEALNPEYETPA